jgi:hypothetical protein
MPKLLRSSETAGCGATIELDSHEIVYVSIAQTGVLVRKLETGKGLVKALWSNFFGPRLYNESGVYKNAQTAHALSVLYPDQTPDLRFTNPVLASFSNAIWHCGTAAQVCIVLNEAASKVQPLEDAADVSAIQRAFEGAKEWSPARPSGMMVATYRVVYSDDVTQETRLTSDEIDSWAERSNRADADKPYRIVRILDSHGKVAWTDKSSPDE